MEENKKSIEDELRPLAEKIFGTQEINYFSFIEPVYDYNFNKKRIEGVFIKHRHFHRSQVLVFEYLCENLKQRKKYLLFIDELMEIKSQQDKAKEPL